MQQWKKEFRKHRWISNVMYVEYYQLHQLEKQKIKNIKVLSGNKRNFQKLPENNLKNGA